MPLLDLMAERANTMLGRTGILNVDRGKLAPNSLSEVAVRLGIAKTPADVGYLDSWPIGLQHALLAAVRSGAEREIPVTLAWQPGYDYGLQIAESRMVGSSAGRITIILTGPYPTP